MTILDALDELTETPDRAAAWMTWLASGDASELPSALRGLELEAVNDQLYDVEVDVRRVVARRRFDHPDGSVWHHVIAEGQRSEAVYVQRLHQTGRDRGTVAIISNGVATVWIDGPGVAPPTEGFERLYALVNPDS